MRAEASYSTSPWIMLFSAVSSRCRSDSSRCCASRFCRVICRMIRNRISATTAAASSGGGDQEPGLRAPVGQRGGCRVGRDDDAGEMGQRHGGAEPVHLVDRTLHDAHRLLAALVQDPLQQRSGREFLSDHRIDVRIARHQGPVGMEHRDRRALSERDGRKEFLVIGGIDAPRHHAEKHAVCAGQPMGNDGVQIAGDKAREPPRSEPMVIAGRT